MRDAGTAILLVSAELDEVLELSDRIAVMYRGELVATPRRPTCEQGRGRPAHGDRRSRGRTRARLRRDGRRRPRQPSPSGGADAWVRSSPSRRSRWRPCSWPWSSPAVIILVSSLVTTGSIDWTLPFVAYAALLQGAFGSESADPEHDPPGHAARPRRAGRRDRLQGGAVQYRWPGPVPAGRDGCRRGRRGAGDGAGARSRSGGTGRRVGGRAPPGASSPAP